MDEGRHHQVSTDGGLIHDGHQQYQSSDGTAKLNQAAGLAPRYGRPQSRPQLPLHPLAPVF